MVIEAIFCQAEENKSPAGYASRQGMPKHSVGSTWGEQLIPWFTCFTAVFQTHVACFRWHLWAKSSTYILPLQILTKGTASGGLTVAYQWLENGKNDERNDLWDLPMFSNAHTMVFLPNWIRCLGRKRHVFMSCVCQQATTLVICKISNCVSLC